MRRFNGQGTNYGLRVGQTHANTNVRYEIVSCAGMQKIAVRLKTSGTCTLDIFFLGPDLDVDAARVGDIAYATFAAGGTVYTTGNATQGTASANTELLVSATPNGEDYAVVKLTGTVTGGTIAYCDVAMLGLGFE